MLVYIKISFPPIQLEESSFNPLRDKHLNHLYMYFKKSHDSLKILYN